MNHGDTIINYFKELEEKTKIVIESMSSWYRLYDFLTENGFEVVISNPVKTKAIASAKIKNDKLGSHMLAQLLRSGLISTVHVSSLETSKLKELSHHRNRLVRDATRVKNRIHALPRKNNFQAAFSDLFGAQGLKYLLGVALPDYQRAQVDTCLTHYSHLVQRIEPLTKPIHALAKGDSTARLLMTIPGIAPIAAMFIIAEVEDISRFASYRNLASYAGLVPSLESSAGKDRRGRISKQGSVYFRTALIEAAQVIPRMKNCRLDLFFRKRIVKSGYQKAIVATVHKILQYAFYVLKNETSYQEEYPICAEPCFRHGP